MINSRWLVVACLVSLFTLPGTLTRGAADEAPAEDQLPRPFTAEQIRDAWVEGLTLELRRVMQEGETRERWTVVSADAEGAVIEFAPVDAKGQVTGDSARHRSTWNELRDHATFPAATANRTEATRETALGEFDGWLYTVTDAAQGTVTELFFARALPGAPLEMKVTQAGRTVMEMTQVSRSNR